MKSEDVLAELRAWRDEFARSHGYDLRAMVAVLQEMDAAAGTRVVRGQPRSPMPPRDSKNAEPRHLRENAPDAPAAPAARGSDA